MKSKFNIKDLLEKVKKKDATKADEATETNEATEGDEKGKKRGKQIFDKVGDLFNYEPQKERVLRQEDFGAAGDVYYASVSAFYKVAERLLWLVLAIFMVFSLITNYREITYNNFFYLMRDFSTAAESQTSNYQILSYDSDSRQKFALYRGGLVCASPSTVSIFTAGGRRTLKNNNDYYSPNVVCCDKYVLVYDTAGSAFSVYNSFSKIYNETLESPITDACFDSEGAFALATRKNDGKTVVYLYDKNVKLRGEIPDTRFVFDMALSSNDDRFASLCYEEGIGVGVTSLTLYDIGSSKSAGALGEIELEGEFPLRCSFLEGGELAVITNRSIRIYDKRLREKEAVEFGEASVTAFDASPNGAAIAINSETRKRVIAFDKNAKLVYNDEVADNVSNVSVYDKFVFIQTGSGVIRLDGQSKKSEHLPCESGRLLIYGEDTAIVCGDAKAQYLVFGKNQ